MQRVFERLMVEDGVMVEWRCTINVKIRNEKGSEVRQAWKGKKKLFQIDRWDLVYV